MKDFKQITEREEFAKAVNFGKYPVIHIDVTKDKKKDWNCLTKKVRVDMGFFNDGNPWLHHCDFNIWMDKDEKNVPHVDIASGVLALTNVGFYEDFIEDVEYANAPILKPNSKAVIVFSNPKKGQIHACIFSTGEADMCCATSMHLSGFVSSCVAGVAVSLCKE